MRVQASRELLASRADAWGFLTEPYHLPDWWPGVAGPHPAHTRATLTVESPWLIAYRRTLARRALSRVHALCQTAAAL